MYDMLETSPYIKDLSNRWVTFDWQTVISCADHFCLKSERVRKILQKVSAQQITVGPSEVTHRLDRSFIHGEVSTSSPDNWCINTMKLGVVTKI